MSAAALQACPACQSPLRTGLHPWHLVCTACSYEGSNLQVDIDVRGDHEVLNEALREEGLSDLRQSNFRTLAAELDDTLNPPAGTSPSLLDVGCGHGWFLKATSPRFTGLGIEPDARIAEMASAQGVQVRKGFFPDVLAADERFDVISFNDVMEHIPNVNAAFDACVKHLKPGGRILVNSPARTGVLYRISKLMNRLGMRGSFERMWQKGFPSPHIHYFDDDSIRAIGQRAGLMLEKTSTLPSISTHGLYARIRYDRNMPAAKAALIAATLTVLNPVLKRMPADIKVWTLRAPG
ncbi:MAG: class I SAM-dependent methyltransferase [Lautropia sp.]|nr:class I SAM-dependent methyltransferase [Lautropia sp.]